MPNCSNMYPLPPNWFDTPKGIAYKEACARIVRECLTCKKQFTPRYFGHNAKFCSVECRVKRNILRNKIANIERGRLNLPTSTIGSISEMHVSADLLSKGYEVFRALSPACSCDLAVLQSSKLLRVEVRTGRFRVTNKAKIRESPFFKRDVGRSDIVATYYPDGLITYVPELP